MVAYYMINVLYSFERSSELEYNYNFGSRLQPRILIRMLHVFKTQFIYSYPSIDRFYSHLTVSYSYKLGKTKF